MKHRKDRHVLLVDNYDSFTFNLIQLVEVCGYMVNIVKNDTLDIEACRSYEKILISPGPGVPSTSGRVCELIRALAPTNSILGVCLGHQAIAEVFGATLFQLQRPMHGMQGTATICEDEPLFNGISNKFCVGLYHSWAVSQMNFPAELKITALSSSDVVMAIAHRDFDVRGIQFHPESIMTEVGKKLIANWLKTS